MLIPVIQTWTLLYHCVVFICSLKWLVYFEVPLYATGKLCLRNNTILHVHVQGMVGHCSTSQHSVATKSLLKFYSI